MAIGFSSFCFLALGLLGRALVLHPDAGPGSGRTLDAQKIPNSSAVGLVGVHSSGCACRSVNANVQNKPPEAVANAGQALPDCFPEHAVTAQTFLTPVSDISTCLLAEGFGPMTMEQKLKCLAPDGVVGAKTAPAIYIIGDSHSAMLRTGIGHASSMPAFSASWWGANHAGKVSDIEDALGKVIQQGDVIAYAMRWDARGVNQYEEDINVILKVIKPKGAHLILFEDNPIMKTQPAGCYMAAAKGSFPTACAKPLPEVATSHMPFINSANSFVAANPGTVHFFQMAPVLCDSSTQTCDYNIPGSWSPAYRDNDHISEDGSLFLSPFICSFMVDAKLHAGGLTNPSY